MEKILVICIICSFSSDCCRAGQKALDWGRTIREWNHTFGSRTELTIQVPLIHHDYFNGFAQWSILILQWGVLEFGALFSGAQFPTQWILTSIDMGGQQFFFPPGSLGTEFGDFLCVAGVGAAEHQAVTRWTVNTHVFDNILKNLKVVCISSKSAFFLWVDKLMLWFSSHSCMNFWDILSSGWAFQYWDGCVFSEEWVGVKCCLSCVCFYALWIPRV